MTVVAAWDHTESGAGGVVTAVRVLGVSDWHYSVSARSGLSYGQREALMVWAAEMLERFSIAGPELDGWEPGDLAINGVQIEAWQLDWRPQEGGQR